MQTGILQLLQKYLVVVRVNPFLQRWQTSWSSNEENIGPASSSSSSNGWFVNKIRLIRINFLLFEIFAKFVNGYCKILIHNCCLLNLING